WRFFYYFAIFWYGLYILHNKPWFKDTKECWYGFPKQHLDTEVWTYYMVEFGFYVSLIFSLCTDVRRKDFRQMMLHHFVTMTLMFMSWCNNMVRVGSLTLCLHDIVDWWLEGAKLANYIRCTKLCDALFIVFALLWFVTRLVIFPLWILNTTFFESRSILGEFGACYAFNLLLFSLLALHFIWFYTILKMLSKYVMKGKVKKDSRSDSESETDSD
ncbi:hypothetical protein HELRODRAFT_131704, partial [Helobdella robusta]|uniref:TLC domain-containing protein n=1 Tax=Helobdella robusta TaxID=6412 RepID=T1EHW3_HELRO